MATTGIWKIEKRLDHVIDYVKNENKTARAGNYQDLHIIDDYLHLDYSSEESCYISGINCLPETAYQNMKDTKKFWNKNGGNLGYHAFQSFCEGEVTPDQAHLIGIKLAEEMWGDRFEVLVTTHINTNHIHNHFVINSVSFKDGKKYHDCHETYAQLRELSDSLCEEYGLNVLDEDKCKKGKVKYSNYYKSYIKNNKYYYTAKEDLDRAIGMAYSVKDFENIMIKMGYDIVIRSGKLSIRRDPYKKKIRIERAFGKQYSLEQIENRIYLESVPRVPFIEAYNPKSKLMKSYDKVKRDKKKGIYGLYRYYCFVLKVFPTYYPKKFLSPEIKDDIKKLNEISKQTRLLVSNKIETYEQFLLYKDNLDNSIISLSSERENLFKQLQKVKTEEEGTTIQNKLNDKYKELSKLKKEVVLCKGIEERLDIVKENIKRYENEKGEKEI